MRIGFAAGAIWLLLTSGCTRTDPSQAIGRHLADAGRVDLAELVPGDWTRVCILGPYANPAREAAALGLDAAGALPSSIASRDDITLLIFARDAKALFSLEHPRVLGDFANLSRQCHARERARFRRHDRPAQGWPGLFPE